METGIEKLCNRIDAFNERVGTLASWIVLVMAGITFLVAVMRYGFNFGRIAMQESITYLHAFVFMIAGAYTLKHNEHVRVDIFYQGMSRQNRAKVDFLGSVFLLLPFAGFIMWTSFDYVTNSWKYLEASREAGGLPLVFVLKSLIPAMATLLFVQAVSMGGRAWLAWRK
ncbi:MAG: TRAP transporter small permease subunit [Gammaproteobacteria bacterium]|nr:TRAP transporter small permease subunit [Gammaproteobacteria bacterium]